MSPMLQQARMKRKKEEKIKFLLVASFVVFFFSVHVALNILLLPLECSLSHLLAHKECYILCTVRYHHVSYTHSRVMQEFLIKFSLSIPRVNDGIAE